MRKNPILSHPALVVTLTLAMTFAAVATIYDFGSGTMRLSVNPSIDPLMPVPSKEREFYDFSRQAFGSDEVIIVGVRSDNALSDGSLNVVAALTHRLRDVSGVSRVVSFDNAPFPRAQGDTIYERTISEWATSRYGDRSWLQWEILKNPLYRKTLLSTDGRVTAVMVFFENVSDNDFIDQEIIETIYSIVDTTRVERNALDMEFWITGGPVVKWATTRAIIASLSQAIPSIVAIVALLLIIAFRSWRGVLLPVSAILISLSWLLAVIVATGRPLNLVTAIVPPISLTLGLAYAVHIIAEYYETLDEGLSSVKKEVRTILRRMSVPLFVTGFTTAAGFLSLMLNPLPAIKEFAIFSTLGVFFSVVVSLTYLPAFLQLLSRPPRRSSPVVGPLARLAPKLAEFDIRNRRVILVTGYLVLIVSIFGASQIKVGTNFINDFEPDSRVRVDYEAINQSLGGANSFSIVIQAHIDDAFVQPEILEALSRFQTWLNAQPEIGTSVSLLDHLRVINQTLHDGDSEYFTVPESATAIKQLLVFAAPSNLDEYVDSRFRNTNITARATPDDSADTAVLVRRIQQELKTLPPPLDGQITGNAVLVTNTLEQITKGQVLSLSAAFFVVFVILALLFTSVRIGLIALVPNILPVAIYYAALGFLGVSLNPTTSLIACLVLGIAVDDTIHYLARFNYEARRVASEVRATSYALRSVLKPVTFTTAALCLGFLVLTQSDLRNHAQFGMLAAFTLAVAWVIDVVFTPAMAAGVRIVTLWDYLRVDLGREPQNAIPLFRDMSLRQARTFALLANIDRFRKDAVVIRQGDKGDDVYVVIEGRLEVHAKTEGGGQLRVAELTRGNVFGEIGYFEEGRSATVTATTEVRLLRFNGDDLDRISKRKPLLAAKLFRNLGKIQSRRVVTTTKMMTDTMT